MTVRILCLHWTQEHRCLDFISIFFYCLQVPPWCWKAQCCTLASWTVWECSFKARMRFGGTPTPPRTLTGRESASWSIFHHRPLKIRAGMDIWPWCAQRGRPRCSWCPLSPASSPTTSRSHPLCWEPTLCLCVTAYAWPASALMGTSWHSGIYIIFCRLTLHHLIFCIDNIMVKNWAAQFFLEWSKLQPEHWNLTCNTEAEEYLLYKDALNKMLEFHSGWIK